MPLKAAWGAEPTANPGPRESPGDKIVFLSCQKDLWLLPVKASGTMGSLCHDEGSACRMGGSTGPKSLV